jgi:hypothetical protein
MKRFIANLFVIFVVFDVVKAVVVGTIHVKKFKSNEIKMVVTMV